MKKSEQAGTVLAQIRELLETGAYGLDNPEAKERFAGLIRILRMHTSGFFPNDTRQIHLNEQIGKLDEYKEDLCSSKQPRLWQTHDECQADMVTCCIKAQGLIERHATDYEVS